MGLMGLVFEFVVLGNLVAGIACNSAVVSTCDMLVLGRNKGRIGPWRADISGYTDGCQGWDKADSDLDDWKLNMGRACSLMSLIFGCILTFFAFFKQCLCPLPLGQKLIDISGAMVQLSLCLTWPMIRSSVCDLYGCSWGDGATALLLTQLFFLGASIFSRCMREPRYERMKERKEERKEERKDDEEERREEGKEERKDDEEERKEEANDDDNDD